MQYDWYWLRHPLTQGWSVLAGSYLDLAYLASVGLAAAGLLCATQSRIARRLVLSLLIAHSAVVVTWGVINIQIVKMIGQPLNYAWLYNSGFLRGLTEPRELGASMTWGTILGFIGLMAAMVTLALGLRALLRRTAGMRTAIAIPALIVVYCLIAAWYQSDFYRPMLQNPAVAFVDSLLYTPTLRLFAMQANIDAKDFEPDATAAMPKARDARVRNVLLIVLESVPAQYMPIYGGEHPVTPELDRYRPYTRVYDAFYAHAPNTNKSLFSLMSGLYPSPDFLLETLEHPDGAFTTLSSVLKSRGYRTGFFYGADVRFGDADRFLEHRDFDTLKDYRTMGNGEPVYEGDSGMPFLDSTDDATLASEVAQWIGQTGGDPFFAMMWTTQTHYPYIPSGEQVAYPGADEMHSRYLNALRETDKAVGALLGDMDKQGILDSTLVIVIGDHGEAFGQHKQFGHGSRIYQENVHVPLLLINRHLFKYERDSTVAGMIDIGPTALGVMGIPCPGSWQGKSVFAEDRCPRTYFMAGWSTSLFGYREGSRKYIFNATTETCEVYDLGKDAGELVDLSATLEPQESLLVQKRLARWVQYQRTALQHVVAASSTR